MQELCRAVKHFSLHGGDINSLLLIYLKLEWCLDLENLHVRMFKGLEMQGLAGIQQLFFTALHSCAK